MFLIYKRYVTVSLTLIKLQYPGFTGTPGPSTNIQKGSTAFCNKHGRNAATRGHTTQSTQPIHYYHHLHNNYCPFFSYFKKMEHLWGFLLLGASYWVQCKKLSSLECRLPIIYRACNRVVHRLPRPQYSRCRYPGKFLRLKIKF